MGNSASNDAALKRGGGSTRLNRPVLSEDDAWDIALAWRDQLRGCVRLETATERLSPSIIPTFEWVTFVFNGSLLVEEGLAHVKDPHKTAAYARAATTAWFALSCCEGYSGTENPQFWRRVFLELLYPKNLPRLSKRVPHPKRGQLPISEAVRFFNDPQRPFPRIKLIVGAADDTTTTELVFLGREIRRGKVRDAQLQRILARLRPLIRRSHWTRRVPVQVADLPTVMKAAALLRGSIPGSSEIEPEPAPHIADSMCFPQMHLQSVSLMRLTSSSIKSLYEQLPSCDVEVELTVGLWNIVHDHRMCDGLLPQNDTELLDETRPRWRVVQLFMMQSTELSYSHLGVLCSAIPHLQSVTTMTLPPNRYSHGTPSSVASDWAWLGYAIFHPDAASQSGFTSLEIELGATSSEELVAFQRMSVGNNLLGGETSSEYLEGRVRKFSAVWTKPNDARRIHTISTEAWVGVCAQGVGALESQGWVCVVVPGYGSGWMRSRDILELRRRRPGKSCIRTLCVNMGRGSVAEPKLALVLAALGDRVTSLSLNFSEIMSASTLQHLLALCPSLKSLRVYHDGSCWADDHLTMELPRLEELSLSIDAHGGPLMPLQELKPACLPRLKALKIVSSHVNSFKHHESFLVSFLASQRVLQYLHWSGGSDLFRTWADTLDDYTSEATRKFLHQLPELDHLSHGPLHLSCRLAFLSVIHRENGRSGVGRLGDELAAFIFQFVTSTTTRKICINPARSSQT